VTQGRRAGRPARRSPNAVAALERVQAILVETCEQDGRGSNLQESMRRKSYRIGINRALIEIAGALAVDQPGAEAARERELA
jgi:hypothetical protein